MNNRLTNFVSMAGNASQIIIASSILAELYLKFRDRSKVVDPVHNPDDYGDHSPSSPPIPLAA